MNQFKATVEAIEKIDTLHLVTFKLKTQTLQMLCLELPPTLNINTRVILEVKHSNIILTPYSKTLISSANQLKAEVKDVTKGEILASISIEIDNNTIESLISLEAFEKLNLTIDDKIVALINLSDISIHQN